MSALAPFLLPLILLFGYVLALFVLLGSWRESLAGARIGRVLVVPLLMGILIIGGLAFSYPGESFLLLPRIIGGGLVAGGVYGLSPGWSVPIGLAVAFLAIAVGEMLIDTIPAAAARLVHVASRRSFDRLSGVMDLTRGTGLVAAILIVMTSAAITSSETR